EDGTKSVHFNVHYGGTGTATFDHDKQVGTTLNLDDITVGGFWIRGRGDLLHAIPHVRRNGEWPKAFAYVRDRGAWKPTRLSEGKFEQTSLCVPIAARSHLAAGYRDARLGSAADLELPVRTANHGNHSGCRHVPRNCAAYRANTHRSRRRPAYSTR